MQYAPILLQRVKKEKEPVKNRLIGIKNSWKYEKDLIIILNGISVIFTIAQVGNIQKPIG